MTLNQRTWAGLHKVFMEWWSGIVDESWDQKEGAEVPVGYYQRCQLVFMNIDLLGNSTIAPFFN